eukprot:4703570-Karenia_brevis.AAC.1
MSCIQSGVIQGSPTAALFFVLGMEPFVRMLEFKINNKVLGLSRLCADDIGCVLENIKHLEHLYTIFNWMEAVSALRVKPKKCLLIPLACDLTQD